jgi:acetyl-CoA carboxylase biotin carboxyl carrier protein
VGLSHDDVREILRIIDESDLEELRVETEGFSLHVRKGGRVAQAEPQRSGPADTATPAPQTAARQAPPPAEDGVVAISSPMLGTFYRAEAPGSPPFVDVGAQVDPETTVCIIEVMKMMNSVAAGVSGTVIEVCGDNGQLVEYGEPLFRVRVGVSG